MMSVPFFLGAHGDLSWADEAELLAWATGVPGLALSWYSLALYVPLARRALREGRTAEAAT
jgi:hypothetical protein